MSRQKVQSYINLETLAGGAFAEKLNEALMQVAENIQNPNTDAAAKRGITVNIKFAPNKTRQVVNTTIAVTTKLQEAQGVSLLCTECAVKAGFLSQYKPSSEPKPGGNRAQRRRARRERKK